MKKIIYMLTAVFVFTSCNKLDIKPVSILQDDQIFTSASGMQAFFAGLYNKLPIEDTKFGASSGYNQFNFIDNINTNTGELTNKNTNGFTAINPNGIYADSYGIIRQAAYVIQTLPKFTSKFSQAQVNTWLGEAYFIRAFTYFELAKRFGGVPLVLTVQNYPEQTLQELQIPRNSEQEVYDQIFADCEKSISLMGATSENRGRANKYVAAALESRAMLYAGSIAKYNSKNTADPATSKRIQGIASTEALRYFKASRAASVLVAAGGYQLYRNSAATDKVGNFVNLFFDASPTNKECIFAREYSLGNAGSSVDVLGVPHQMTGPNGYGQYINVTEDFVELFDGLPKNADGSLKTTDASGRYILYGSALNSTTPAQVPYSTYNTINLVAPAASNIITDVNTTTTNNVISNQAGIFQGAEPRLLATVIVPGAIFKGQYIDVRRGVYTGTVSGGVTTATQYPLSNNNPYQGQPGLVENTAVDGPPAVNIGNPGINVPAGTMLNSGGKSGVYKSRNGGTVSGYHLRKYVDQQLNTPLVTFAGSIQPWLEIRYAEIELNRAEADWELNSLGQSDINYMQDAFTMINDIRDRAGATLLATPGDLVDVNVIRKERRKELCGENKIYWDMIRWRTFDTEVNNRTWLVLNPFYVVATGQYFYDRRNYEGNSKYTFPISAYYINIPAGEITKNPKLYQNQ